MVFCEVCDTCCYIECVEFDHNYAHNTAVFICHLCIKKTFSYILQYLRYNIDCFLNNNSRDPVVGLLDNTALLSKDKIRGFTLLRFPINYFEN